MEIKDISDTRLAAQAREQENQRKLIARATTEAVFQAEVMTHGQGLPRPWLMYHTHRSDRSEAGFPDVIALRGSRMVVAELKALKKNGTPKEPTEAQQRWLDAFRATGAEVYVWTPLDWPTIKAVLA